MCVHTLMVCRTRMEMQLYEQFLYKLSGVRWMKHRLTRQNLTSAKQQIIEDFDTTSSHITAVAVKVIQAKCKQHATVIEMLPNLTSALICTNLINALI